MTDQTPAGLVETAKWMRDRPPTPDPITEGALSYFGLCRSLREAYPQQFSPVSASLQDLRSRLDQRFLADTADLELPVEAEEVPRVSIDTLETPEFAQYVKEPCPLIIHGAAAATQATTEWTPAFFGEKYGSFACVLATDSRQNLPGTIADAVDDILAAKEEARYAHNIADIFNDHPDLEAQLELDRFLPHLGPGRHLGTHLFIGGSRTGTAFHCANNLNVFFNVFGEKQWFFVHPKHTFWMYGVLHKTGAYGDSPIDHRKSAAAQRDEFPLFEQVPVYSARLGPGDVLINPPWWWHAVDNLTIATIGCAVRWLPYKIRDANPVFSLAQRLVPHAQEVMKVLMSDPRARITDELYRDQFDLVRKEK